MTYRELKSDEIVTLAVAEEMLGGRIQRRYVTINQGKYAFHFPGKDTNQKEIPSSFFESIHLDYFRFLDKSEEVTLYDCKDKRFPAREIRIETPTKRERKTILARLNKD